MNDFANLIFLNARVYTVDDENPHAEAVAVQGQTIVYVGSNEGVEAWRGPQTEVVDGQGRSLLPGFIDSHFHLMHGALGMGDIQLYEVSTLAELETAVHAYAQLNPDLPWLRGQGLRYSIPSIEEPLTRHHLDAIEAQRSLVLIAYDLHTAWANTAALEKAGLLHGGAPLPGGAEFVMGELTLRVNMPYNVLPETPLEALEEEAVPMSEQFQSEMVRAGAVKFFMDGVYESYTAVNRKAWTSGHNSHN